MRLIPEVSWALLTMHYECHCKLHVHKLEIPQSSRFLNGIFFLLTLCSSAAEV